MTLRLQTISSTIGVFPRRPVLPPGGPDLGMRRPHVKTNTPQDWAKNYRRTFERARGDALQGRYSPPGGTGFSSQINRQVFGTTPSQKAYDKGYKRGK